MTQAMTIAGQIEEKMAALGKDLSNRSDKITEAVEKHDPVYIQSVTTLYIHKFAEIQTELLSLQEAMQPEGINADK